MTDKNVCPTGEKRIGDWRFERAGVEQRAWSNGQDGKAPGLALPRQMQVPLPRWRDRDDRQECLSHWEKRIGDWRFERAGVEQRAWSNGQDGKAPGLALPRQMQVLLPRWRDQDDRQECLSHWERGDWRLEI